MSLIEEFTVAWDDPSDADLSWSRDSVHAPDVMRPLGAGFATFVAHGLTEVFREYSIPVKAARYRVINGYLYTALELMDEPPDELLRLAKEAESKLIGVMPRLEELWQETYLPEIKSLLEELEEFDLRGASLDGLVAQWHHMLDIELRLFEIHFLILLPSMLAVSEFDELYRQLVPQAAPHEPFALLQGFDNLTLATGRELWRLAESAKTSPDVIQVLESTPEREVVGVLETSASGRVFLDELRVYLDEYGQRGDKWDQSYPSWIEDPTPVIANLKEYVRCSEHPAAELERAAAVRERLVGEARGRLAENPMLPMFEFLLKAAQEGIVISEDHGFWIDFRGGYRFRVVCLEFGRRFAEAGVIPDASDVFCLWPDELIETASQFPAVDRKTLIEERKLELEHWNSVVPPELLGAEPATTGIDDNPLVRAFGKFFGDKPTDPGTETELHGNPGSPGVVRGPARIITSVSQADRLDAGDVLVAPTTAPPWTPLFAIASAVVTDSGGILSHCAVVAREYGIPAVVGCGDATTRIRDGQLIEVDGTQGVVHIVG